MGHILHHQCLHYPNRRRSHHPIVLLVGLHTNLTVVAVPPTIKITLIRTPLDYLNTSSSYRTTLALHFRIEPVSMVCLLSVAALCCF
ncbi:hypothetical protein CsSME_00021562 [Camellia sinensis var. sinensis]